MAKSADVTFNKNAFKKARGNDYICHFRSCQKANAGWKKEKKKKKEWEGAAGSCKHRDEPSKRNQELAIAWLRASKERLFLPSGRVICLGWLRNQNKTMKTTKSQAFLTHQHDFKRFASCKERERKGEESLHRRIEC